MSDESQRAICRECVLALGLDRSEFELQWEVLEARGLTGSPFTFGDTEDAAGEHQLFGLAGHPVIEAVIIAVIGNALYDCVKLGAREASDRLRDEHFRARLIINLGEIGDAAQKLAARALDWLSNHISRVRSEGRSDSTQEGDGE